MLTLFSLLTMQNCWARSSQFTHLDHSLIKIYHKSFIQIFATVKVPVQCLALATTETAPINTKFGAFCPLPSAGPVTPVKVVAGQPIHG